MPLITVAIASYLVLCVCAQSLQPCPTFVILWTLQFPLFMGSSRQEYLSGFPCPSTGDLPDPGLEPGYPACPALQVDSLPTEILGRPIQFFQFSSVAQSCLTLGDPMNRSTPGLPVHHQLLESTQNPCPLSRWCHPAISSSVIPFFSHLQSFPASGSCPMSQLFSLGGQSIGDSASTSVLPMNTQAWFPLERTGWISLQSKGLSRVFSNTTVQKHQFFGTQLSLYSNSHIHTWLLEKP